MTDLCPSGDENLVETSTAFASLRRSSLLQVLNDDNYNTQRVDFHTSLSLVLCAVVLYTAVFGARKVYAGTSPNEYCTTLMSTELPEVVSAKTNGGLVAPSKYFLKLRHAVEKGFSVYRFNARVNVLHV